MEAAQLFSWGGDLALLGPGRRSFLTGVAASGLAHVAYIAAFAGSRYVDRPILKAGITKIALGVWLTTAPFMARAAARKDPAPRLPVAGYVGVLTAMFANSTMLRRSIPTQSRLRIVGGTSLFLISDALLGARMFLRDEPSPPLEAGVMSTYTLGQWLIADGAIAAQHTRRPVSARRAS